MWLDAIWMLVLLVLSMSSVGCREIRRDACLDRGGCWDDARNRCELVTQERCQKATKEK